ncbi:TPA: hypothetical protein UOP39_000001, partial [Clostridioides difficile]|nr:hypothetical protein [Clostridioides difficile]
MKKYLFDFKNVYNVTGIIRWSIIVNIILLVVDKNNILSKVISFGFNKEIYILMGIFILVSLFDFGLLNSLKIKIVNDIDMILIFSIIILFTFSVISLLTFKEVTYRVYVSIIFIFILAVLLIYRITSFNKLIKALDKKSNIYSLKDLYDGCITENNEFILVSEEYVDYDLLDRDRFINNLYNIITNCNPQRKFIISLEGPWGSGKTTVLNIVKNKIKENNLDTIIIDDFDPWSFDDNSSMFRGMFDILLKKSGIKFSATQSKKIIDSLYGVLFTDEDRKKIRALGLYNEESFSEINKIKKMINNYLQLSNKKVVFIIDNIDRIEKENITLLFKLVNNILDFDYVTYILAFDGENMKNIMQDELKIDYDYLKKIVQLQVKLPNIQSDVKINIIDRCIKNILILYGEKEENLNEYDILINKLGVIIKDIRDLKRFINSVVSFNYRSNKYLNIIEIFIIELIKMYNNNLYNSIYNNSQFFISHDKIWLNSISSLINKQQFNKEGKAYFDNLFSDENNKEYQSILSEIFPYVKKYKCGEDLECTVNAIISNHEEYKSIEKKKSICSAKFFDLYFAQTDNDFIYISNAIDIFIELINNSDNKINIMDNLYLLIRKFPKETHKTVFETMQYYIGDIKVENLHYLAYALFSNIYEIEDAREFMGLSGRSRASMIISDILLLMP